jgi:beta-galactosidase
VTQRSATSLLPGASSPVTYGFKPSNLYFCDQRPSEITSTGLAGALIDRSVVLLKDCDTDWMKWNGQPEYAKTAMVFRSEQEAKPSGVVLAEKQVGKGRILLTTLPSAPRTIKAERLPRGVLANLGIQLQPGLDLGKPLLRTGILVRALASGYFVPGVDTAPEPWKNNAFRANTPMNGKQWRPVFQESGTFDLSKLDLTDLSPKAELYLSFWVSSPRSLDELLLEPNLPQVDLQLMQRGSVKIWLNDEPQTVATATGEFSSVVAGLKLRSGWNHFLLKLTRDRGQWQFGLRLTSNQPEFLGQLDSALERP